MLPCNRLHPVRRAPAPSLNPPAETLAPRPACAPAPVVTIADVSRRAGVSTATVSRVVNHPERVDAGTRARVAAIIEELGYRPNELARGLSDGSSRTVGIVIPLFGSSYYGLMLDGAVRALRELGFHALVEASGESGEGEERAWVSLASRRCDALVAHSDRQSDERLAALMRAHPNAVLLNRLLPGFEDRSVHLDNARGGALAAERLLGAGHRRLATLGGPSAYPEARDRARGFAEALAARGLPLPGALARETDFGEEGGRAAMAALLDAGEPFTGVFCHSDEIAIGALAACRERGLRVPEDLSLVGFDDLRVARHLTPPLDTVRQPLEAMGFAAASLAHALATGRADPARGVVRAFVPSLVRRASVGPPPTAPRSPPPTPARRAAPKESDR